MFENKPHPHFSPRVVSKKEGTILKEVQYTFSSLCHQCSASTLLIVIPDI